KVSLQSSSSAYLAQLVDTGLLLPHHGCTVSLPKGFVMYRTPVEPEPGREVGNVASVYPTVPVTSRSRASSIPALAAKYARCSSLKFEVVLVSVFARMLMAAAIR